MYVAAVECRPSVKPGMIGLWQVSGREVGAELIVETPLVRAVRLSLRYVEAGTPAMEVKTQAGTAQAVLPGGAAS